MGGRAAGELCCLYGFYLWVMRTVLLCLAVSAVLGAQSRAAFDVASVKVGTHAPVNGELSSRSRIEFTPTSLTMTNVTLRDCVQWAYRARFYEVSGPGLIDGERYDIVAKTSTGVTPDELRAMVQPLLADRFKLALHREVKSLNVFELRVDKGGPKLPRPKTDAEGLAVHSVDSLPLVRDGSFVFPDASMAEFAGKVSLLRGVGAPVIDKTGIAGVYDIVLEGAANALRQEDGAPISEFMRQLGLKMVAAKDTVEVIVVDSASRPSRN
jgi:uncharacterized protein (TIGR03435 family)